MAAEYEAQGPLGFIPAAKIKFVLTVLIPSETMQMVALLTEAYAMLERAASGKPLPTREAEQLEYDVSDLSWHCSF